MLLVNIVFNTFEEREHDEKFIWLEFEFELRRRLFIDIEMMVNEMKSCYSVTLLPKENFILLHVRAYVDWKWSEKRWKWRRQTILHLITVCSRSLADDETLDALSSLWGFFFTFLIFISIDTAEFWVAASETSGREWKSYKIKWEFFHEFTAWFVLHCLFPFCCYVYLFVL